MANPDPLKPAAANRGKLLEALALKVRGVLSIRRMERNLKTRLPWRDTVRAWSHGFSRWSYSLYGLDRNDPRLYFSDWTQFTLFDGINGPHRPAAQQKAIFAKYLEFLGVPSPPVLAVVVRGRIYDAGDLSPTAGWPWLRARLAERPHGVVLKPIKGCEGIGVAFLRKSGSGYQLDGRPQTEEEAAAYVSRLEDFMITEFAVQHEYAARIYPETTNTLRLLTLWDYEADAPFLAQAVHRIGTRRSFPVDNFKMGAGGLSAWIDPGTGELGPAAGKPEAGRVEWHDTHPETGAPIRGCACPAGRRRRAEILRLSALPAVHPLHRLGCGADRGGIPGARAEPRFRDSFCSRPPCPPCRTRGSGALRKTRSGLRALPAGLVTAGNMRKTPGVKKKTRAVARVWGDLASPRGFEPLLAP